jgi:hypothetical protein
MAHVNTQCYANSVKDVQKRTENVNTDEDPSGWRPYYTFVDSLREKYAKNEGFQGTTVNIFVSPWI